MLRRHKTIARIAKVLPVLALYQSLGCLPNNAFAEVFAENVVFTSAIVIQSITSIIFNNLFPIFPLF